MTLEIISTRRKPDQGGAADALRERVLTHHRTRVPKWGGGGEKKKKKKKTRERHQPWLRDSQQRPATGKSKRAPKFACLVAVESKNGKKRAPSRSKWGPAREERAHFRRTHYTPARRISCMMGAEEIQPFQHYRFASRPSRRGAAPAQRRCSRSKVTHGGVLASQMPPAPRRSSVILIRLAVEKRSMKGGMTAVHLLRLPGFDNAGPSAGGGGPPPAARDRRVICEEARPRLPVLSSWRPGFSPCGAYRK